MSKKSTSKDSRTDWQGLLALRDEEIDFSDIPEITEEQLERATLRLGGQKVPQGKLRINIHLDAEVIAYFKAQAGGRGYQTLINEALRESIRTRDLATLIRTAIREELQTVKQDA